MSPNLTVLEINQDDDDIEVVLRADSVQDRFFPPLLAAQTFLLVRGLVEQDCDSRPETPSPRESARPRRWAFAQEIYSNGGRGTESGHFLEHLALQMASLLHEESGGPSRVMSAETQWDFRIEPNVYRLRFHNLSVSLLREALVRCREVLSRLDYLLDLSLVLSA